MTRFRCVLAPVRRYVGANRFLEPTKVAAAAASLQRQFQYKTRRPEWQAARRRSVTKTTLGLIQSYSLPRLTPSLLRSPATEPINRRGVPLEGSENRPWLA